MKTIDLHGVIDMHVHTAPDVLPRLMNDVELAREVAAVGMRAFLMKSHHTLTSDRAAISSEQVQGIQVFGGLVLNHAVGGLNLPAVETALAMGAREIWMPTLTAANHLIATHTGGEGISVLDESGEIKPIVIDILALISEHDVILGTGHLSVDEILPLVKVTRDVGVKRILITHPELPIINMSLEVQESLRGPDLFFERCLYSVVTPGTGVSMATIGQAVKKVGYETTVLATDFGQVDNPSSVEGMRMFIAGMLEQGITEGEINRMVMVNPSRLLDLD